jgi:hypothetical protein
MVARTEDNSGAGGDISALATEDFRLEGKTAWPSSVHAGLRWNWSDAALRIYSRKIDFWMLIMSGCYLIL